MKLFADTANIQQIEKLALVGLIDGVTTNPSLFSKEPKGDFISMCKRITQICSDSKIPLSVEVFSEDPDDVYADAIRLFKQLDYQGLSIKIPIDIKYLPVIKKLANEGISINATCGYTASQLTMAAKCGARYVSLFYRRALDSGEDVESHLQLTRKFIETKGLNCEIIAGSIRKPDDILCAWKFGAHIATASPSIIDLSLQHEGSRASIDAFMKDFSSWVST